VIAPEEKLQQIKSFIEGLKLQAPELDEPSGEMKRVYKLFHGLLLEDMAVESNNFKDATKNYFREVVSEASSALFLTLIGSYKPARLVLRGACENVLRFLVGSQGDDASKLTTVAALFSEAKQLCAGEGLQLGYISKLEAAYDELCKTSHATHVDYMGLAVPFSALFIHKEASLKANLDLLQRTFEQVLYLAFAQLAHRLNVIGHANADTLRSIIPRSLKAALSE
jgi:hypothetical protein